MQHPTDFHNWSENIMNSMNDAQKASASPYLFTRVLQKAELPLVKNNWETITAWITKPAIAFSILFLVICLNFFLINSSTSRAKKSDIQTDFYNTSISSVYDVDNITP